MGDHRKLPTHQQRLDIAWAHEDSSIEELAEALMTTPVNAMRYRKIVGHGVRRCMPLNNETWHALKARLDAGETCGNVAMSAGYTTESLRHWINTHEPEAGPTRSQLALRLPFSRFSELYGSAGGAA